MNNFNISHEERVKRAVSQNRIPVFMIDKNTDEILNSFAGLQEAENFLGKIRSKQHIAEVCRGKRKTAYGYKWKFAFNKN